MNEIAKAVFFIDGDENAYEYQAAIVEYDGRKWFVANRFLEIATGMQIPAELIALDRLPHIFQADGLCRLGTLIPMELGTYPMPERLRHAYGAVENPALAHILPRPVICSLSKAIFPI